MPDYERSFRSVSDRYAQEVDARSDEMLADEQREMRLTLPANMVQPQPAHYAVMKAVDQILTMGLTHSNANSAPPMLRSTVRLLRRLEPMLLEQLSMVPEAEVILMVRTLAAGLMQLADSVDNGSSERPTIVAPARPAEPPSP